MWGSIYASFSSSATRDEATRMLTKFLVESRNVRSNERVFDKLLFLVSVVFFFVLLKTNVEVLATGNYFSEFFCPIIEVNTLWMECNIV